MATCVILQSNYIPWKGYFDLIHRSDVCVFYDMVQYTKNDWRNRNRIATAEGLKWLTIPVRGSLSMAIDEVLLPSENWRRKHLESIRHVYAKAKFGKDILEMMEQQLLHTQHQTLSQLNQSLIVQISKYLGISSRFCNSRDLQPSGDRIGRLKDICRKVGASDYLSGPAAREYIGDDFDDSQIKITWMEYGPYPEYPQFGNRFEHGVSILDLIAHRGPDAPSYIWP